MNPRHQNPSRRDRTAHAPYNFVPLPEKVVLAEPLLGQDTYHRTRHTGWIRCTLTTLSPLYTRTMLNPDFFSKWSETRAIMQDDSARSEYAEFFHLDDAQRPVIPGSSLRGMVRGLVEIAGYGKIQWVTNDPLAFRAVGDPTSLRRHYRNTLKSTAIGAGYIEKDAGEWRIRPARPIEGAAFARISRSKIPQDARRWRNCRNAHLVYVVISRPQRAGMLPTISNASSSPSPSHQEAVLVTTGQIQGKTKEFVFGLPNDDAALIEIPDQIRSAYRGQVTPAQNDLLQNDDGALRPSQPVFYLLENGRLKFFGHCMMFRLPYRNTPLDLVPPALQTDAEDLAEAIFGFTRDRRSYAGRVFFSDAKFQSASNGVWLATEPFAPTVLSSPKPTTFQHYVTQQSPDDKKQLDHYDSPPLHPTIIRGHKLYWHRGPVGMGQIQETEPFDWTNDTQHTAMKPVGAGVTFTSQVRFENLSDVELGALLWALTLPGEPGKRYRHKLGMGKPLGMGSVSIVTELYLSDRPDRYSRLFDGQSWHLAESREPELARFTEPFETYVLERMDPRERAGAEALKGVRRIKMLLRLLEWPGPDLTTSGYMKIEPTNEYKDRPVLPDPLAVY